MAEPNSGEGYSGHMDPTDAASEFNAHSFLIRSILATISTATLVMVKQCTNAGGVAAVGFVDVQPMVNMIDGNDNAVPHGVIYRCPYFRLQGGANAIILDPQPGDIGIAIFADRDISSATVNRKASNPGSRRRFDMSDGLYIGGVLNGVPNQFIEFSGGGITVTSPTKVTVNAPLIEMNADTQAKVTAPLVQVDTALLKVSGDIIDNFATNTRTVGEMRTVYNTHTHPGDSGGTTGGPSTGM